MTTKEMYHTALNQIINSDSTDVAVLRKIALGAFAQPIKEVADAPALNWFQYNDNDWEWYLKVNEVQVACLSKEDEDGKWVLRDYDTDFAGIFGGGSMPEFDNVEEGQHYVRLNFLMWLKDTSEELIKPKQ